MKRIAGLREIADQFDLYLVDQYGVLHDGAAAYPGAIDAMARLASGGRRIIVLTNSGKGASENAARLASLGFPGAHIHAVVSSGDVALQLVRSGAFGPRFALSADVCVIGRSGDSYAFSPADFNLVVRPQAAAFLVFAGSDAPRTSLEAYRSMLTPAAHARVPALCVNPDITMIRDGELVAAPGAIAKIYHELGGSVEHVGKPHRAIFSHALSVAAMGADARIIMIGDSPEHDLCGARTLGLAALLVRTGIHRSLSEPEYLALCASAYGMPEFLAEAFRW
jgi:HAD superfamily hydrolase (TIGR01459 family)